MSGLTQSDTSMEKAQDQRETLASMQEITVPDYYKKFSCIGPRCEDTCCNGWNVPIDRDTYHEYKRNQHPVLLPMFKLAVVRNKSALGQNPAHFGLMKMKADQTCHFLQVDKLCAIQTVLGEQALSDTCRIYPRYFNQFGTQREHSLGISCPEAARLILLNPNPIQFSALKADATQARTFTSHRFPLTNSVDPEQLAVLNDFRAVIIGVLQCRTLSIGGRMMLLGWLLEDADKVISAKTFAHASELLPVLERTVSMLAHPTELEAQFALIPSSLPRKLEAMTLLIAKSLTAGASKRFSECLLAATEGLTGTAPGSDAALLTQYTQNHAAFYQPFFQDHAYIFENYLVNQVITRLFPFVRGSYLDLYREMVFNLSILQVLLVGMAGKDRGLTQDSVIQLFQSFARKSDHNRSHLDDLISTLQPGERDSFGHVMWMLKEVDSLPAG
jgi:lysine-N-methylase